jgi:hypothetical protein
MSDRCAVASADSVSGKMPSANASVFLLTLLDLELISSVPPINPAHPPADHFCGFDSRMSIDPRLIAGWISVIPNPAHSGEPAAQIMLGHWHVPFPRLRLLMTLPVEYAPTLSSEYLPRQS